MIIILLGFYGLAFFFALNKPNAFLIFYLLASTKFLGFLDPAEFIIGGIEIGYSVLNLIAVFSIFFKKDWFKFPKNSYVIILLIIALLLYGVLRPVLSDFSSIKQALISSKDTWFYAIFIYLIVYYENIDLNILVKFVKWIALFFTINYCLFFVYPALIPPYYYEITHIRTFFPTYISLAIFFYLIELKLMNKKSLKLYAIIGFLFLGLIFATHTALTIMTLMCSAIYLFAFDENLELKKDSIIKLFGVFIFCFSIALIFINGLYNSIINEINAVIYSEDIALQTRDLYNKFRWEAINKEKFFGYGYVHQSSKLMAQYKLSGTSAFMERFTVIDSGYVDLLIKFGYLGTTLILAILSRFYFIGIIKKYRNHITLAMSLYLVQYIFINYTWSVYTFSHGIIPSAIAFYIIMMYQDSKINEIETL